MNYMLGALIIIVPLLCIWCYRQGMRDRKAMEQGKELEKLVDLQRLKPGKGDAEESQEQAEYRHIMANLEAYDGTNRGQVRG